MLLEVIVKLPVQTKTGQVAIDLLSKFVPDPHLNKRSSFFFYSRSKSINSAKLCSGNNNPRPRHPLSSQKNSQFPSEESPLIAKTDLLFFFFGHLDFGGGGVFKRHHFLVRIFILRCFSNRSRDA